MASSSFLLPPGLSEIFQSRPLLDAFHESTAATFCEENLQFIEDVLLLKASQNLGAINNIFITYIASNSPLQVNIDAAIRSATTDRFNRLATMTPAEQLTIFDLALSKVTELVERDSVPKFLQQQRARFAILLRLFELFNRKASSFFLFQWFPNPIRGHPASAASSPGSRRFGMVSRPPAKAQRILWPVVAFHLHEEGLVLVRVQAWCQSHQGGAAHHNPSRWLARGNRPHPDWEAQHLHPPHQRWQELLLPVRVERGHGTLDGEAVHR